MKRTLERKLIYAACIWQLFTGILTIFYYSFHLKNQGNAMESSKPAESLAIHSLMNNLYSFTVTYGLFFVVIALVNFILTNRMVRDQTIQIKMPLFWILLAVIFFFLSDFISVALCFIAAVMALSKNKSTKIMLEGK